ncbi:DUF5060 domain-containing protein [Mesoflavibacter zeaxanthinifaciens]|uniref:DUF5060 domain-containing protein n=1 Tax=Mesoflavibacter zeaxanthinifaciens TaxID=393060 RepID=UPI003A92D633
MKTYFKTYLSLIFLLFNMWFLMSQNNIEKWDRYEVVLNHKIKKGVNPYQDIDLTAKFYNADTTFVVNGFYDGKDTFRLRFMPQQIGDWQYITASNIEELNKKTGGFKCVSPANNNHGMVQVNDTYYFKYSDGKQYYPFGTTAYAWIHMGQELQEETLNTLKNSGFNKLRMCVLSKNYKLVKEEPIYYPFELKKVKTNSEGMKEFEWDFSQFNPEFFQHLERRIDDLNKIGVQADLILFHPYDDGRWGFDSMSPEVNIAYVKYLTARLSSFQNVWWSLANEWDYVTAKEKSEWDTLIKTVNKNDPYGHLCSIHGSTAMYYDYWMPEITHVSIQDEAPVLNSYTSATLRNVYKKPIVLDEVGYEGNLRNRWGRLSPEMMMHMTWNGVIAGAYVTHGETYLTNNETDTIFWADGGSFKGTSPKRIAFLRDIVETAPEPLYMADISRDTKTAAAGKGYYLMYFGKDMQEAWLFNLPKKNSNLEKLKEGARFKVEIIDAWDMTITEYPEVFETMKVDDDYRLYDKELKEIRLPYKPFIALRIKEVD